MIGKGKRSKEVLDAVKRNGSVYFAAVGGAGALLSKCIKTSEVVAYDDLGTESIRKLYVEDFPVIVVAIARRVILRKCHKGVQEDMKRIIMIDSSEHFYLFRGCGQNYVIMHPT